jgi:hypothetical protein
MFFGVRMDDYVNIYESLWCVSVWCMSLSIEYECVCMFNVGVR